MFENFILVFYNVILGVGLMAVFTFFLRYMVGFPAIYILRKGTDLPVYRYTVRKKKSGIPINKKKKNLIPVLTV